LRQSDRKLAVYNSKAYYRCYNNELAYIDLLVTVIKAHWFWSSAGSTSICCDDLQTQ